MTPLDTVGESCQTKSYGQPSEAGYSDKLSKNQTQHDPQCYRLNDNIPERHCKQIQSSVGHSE